MMLAVNDVYALITYLSYVEAIGWGSCVLGLLILRWTQPEAERPIKVNLFFPVTFLFICVSLICASIFLNPAQEILAATGIVLSGVPVYYIFVKPTHPQWFRRFARKCNHIQLSNSLSSILTSKIFFVSDGVDWYTSMVFNGVMALDEEETLHHLHPTQPTPNGKRKEN